MIPHLLNRILVRSCCELRTGWDSRARLNGRRVTGGEAPSPLRALQKYISRAGSVSRAASLWWLSVRYYMRRASPLDGTSDEPGRPKRAWFWCDEGLLSRAGPANAIKWKNLSPVSRDTGISANRAEARFSKAPETFRAQKRHNKRRIYTTFILSTALLNFGTRANNIGHGPLDFCRVKANFSARVPKNLGGPRPPREVVSARLKRGPRAETMRYSRPQSLCAYDWPGKQGLWAWKWTSGHQNLVPFRREEISGSR